MTICVTTLRRRKRATNLGGVDEQVLERKRWLERNRRALEAYNEHVEKHGAYSDGLRSF